MKALDHILSQTKRQTPLGLWPLGFLAFGLALDVASGSPLEYPREPR